MRVIFGFVAVVLGLLSMALTARYGYKGAETELDGIINAAIFGSIALCAFLFDGAAVRLWFTGHFKWSITIGVIASAALVVTITNSLGGIAGRADATQAERTQLVEAKAEIKRLTAEKGRLPAFAPADDAVVTAARAAVAGAERARAAECDRRGPECRKREGDETASREALSSALSRKALTDRAAELDRKVDAERAKLAKAPLVENANPLGHALELMIGAAAATLTAWQQAAVAVVFELCLVGVMVLFELLGHAPAPPASAPREPAKATTPPPGRTWGVRPKLPSQPLPAGSIADFLCEVLESDPGGRIEVNALYATYRKWCLRVGRMQHTGAKFVDQLNEVRKAVGLDIDEDGGKVYCMGVKLAA